MIAVAMGSLQSEFTAVPGAPGATTLTKPWIAYSGEGVLGLMWRAVYPDRTYDIWAAIMRDAGKSFSRALRTSHAKSPAVDHYRNLGNVGEDIQNLSMDKDNMHPVWATIGPGSSAFGMGE